MPFSDTTFVCLQTLSQFRVLPAIEFILNQDDCKMKSAAIDIFSYIVEFSPSMVREFILKEGQNQDDVSTCLKILALYMFVNRRGIVQNICVSTKFVISYMFGLQGNGRNKSVN